MSQNSSIEEKNTYTLHPDPFGKDELHKAIHMGDEELFNDIMKKVKDSSVSLSRKDYLIWAVQYGRYNFISKLIISGCEPYLSVGSEPSMLNYSLLHEDARLLVEIVNASQRCPDIAVIVSSSEKSFLKKPFSRMTGLEEMVAIILITKMEFKELSFFVTELNPVVAYSLYSGKSMEQLANETPHSHVKDLIKSA